MKSLPRMPHPPCYNTERIRHCFVARTKKRQCHVEGHRQHLMPGFGLLSKVRLAEILKLKKCLPWGNLLWIIPIRRNKSEAFLKNRQTRKNVPTHFAFLATLADWNISSKLTDGLLVNIFIHGKRIVRTWTVPEAESYRLSVILFFCSDTMRSFNILALRDNPVDWHESRYRLMLARDESEQLLTFQSSTTCLSGILGFFEQRQRAGMSYFCRLTRKLASPWFLWQKASRTSWQELAQAAQVAQVFYIFPKDLLCIQGPGISYSSCQILTLQGFPTLQVVWLVSRPPGSKHFTYIMWLVSDILSMHFVNCVVLFCACDIYRTSVQPGRGIPPRWLFLRFRACGIVIHWAI